MSDQPVASVLVPEYRAEATLPGAVRSLLSQTCRSWQAKFAANRRVSRLFRQYVLTGRCASLEHSLDMTRRGRAPWVEAKQAGLSEEPARAA